MRKIFTDVGYMGLSQFIVALGQILLQVYVVRSTTMQDYGEYIGSMVIVSLVEAIFVARGGELAIRYVGSYWHKGDYVAARQTASTIIHIDRIVNWILYMVLVSFSLITFKILNINLYYIICMSLTIPAQIGYGMYKSLFIITSRLAQQSLFEITFAIVLIITGILGVYLYGIYGLIASNIITAFIKTILSKKITNKWWPNKSYGNNKPEHNSNISIKTWWKDSLHSIVRNTFFSGSNQIDIIILNIFKGAEAVALYKVAKTLSMIPVKIAAPVWSALRPRIIKSWNEINRSKFKKMIIIPSQIMMVALFIMILPVWIYGNELISVLYGQEYLQAAKSFMILIVGVWTLNVVTGWYRFWVLIITDRKSGTRISAILFFTLLILGLIVGKESITTMSIIVTIVMVLVSIICWAELFRKIKEL